jgi:Flp pilus assembly protein CpaB
LVEGIPGIELAETLRLDPAAVRKTLERGLAELARISSQRNELGNDRWLWEYAGSPSPFLARLELLLPVLRHEVLVSATPWRTDVTHLDLLPMGRAESLSESANPTLPANELPVEARLGSTRSARASEVRTEAEGPAHAIPALPSLVEQSLPPRDAQRLLARLASSGALGGDRDRTAHDDPDRTVTLPTPARGPSGDEATDRPLGGASRRAGAKARAQGPAGRSKPLPKHVQKAPGDSARTEARPFIQRGVSSNETRIGVASPLTRGWRQGPRLWGAVALVAVALAAGAAALLGSPAQQRWTLVDVVVAAEDLEEGALVTSENTAVRAVPRATHAGGETTELVKVDDVRFALNQRLATPVFEGDPLFFTELEAIRLQRGLTRRPVRRGRGVSITAWVSTEVAQLVKQGDRVDVTAALRGADGAQVTTMVTEGARVLATGHIGTVTNGKRPGAQEAPWTEVTLLVPPEEAERLSLAATLAPLRLGVHAEPERLSSAAVDSGDWSDSKSALGQARLRLLQSQRSAIIAVIRGADRRGDTP